MNLWNALAATARTLWRQATCSHGPWLRDFYSTLPGNVPSAHCKLCWKTSPQAAVRSREETRGEYIVRATGAGMSACEAGVFFDSHGS